jgi:glycosyltransferase involved in cell wall biosynthesis
VINFVSNIPAGTRSGGFSAMSTAACEALNQRYRVHFVGPIDPQVLFRQKALSKLLRVSGLPGDFFFFSRARLETIARQVEARCCRDTCLDFFHGFTPWVLTAPPRPYIAWSDCTFRDYIDIFHDREQFRATDLARIEDAEAGWLRRACRVLFSSEWAAHRAKDSYGLDAHRVGSVGIFGESEVPDGDAYAGGMEFGFVSTNFDEKGGPTVLSAFQEARKRHAGISLVIVGDRPPDLNAEPGVRFTGFLRKEVVAERRQFQEILGHLRALIHPTRGDISPLVIVEAGYHGCPAIASRAFAIPEVVDHGKTGLLLDDPSSVDAIAEAMVWLIERPEEYRHMRHAIWSKAHRHFTKERFQERLLSRVTEVLRDQGFAPARYSVFSESAP